MLPAHGVVFELVAVSLFFSSCDSEDKHGPTLTPADLADVSLGWCSTYERSRSAVRGHSASAGQVAARPSSSTQAREQPSPSAALRCGSIGEFADRAASDGGVGPRALLLAADGAVCHLCGGRLRSYGPSDPLVTLEPGEFGDAPPVRGRKVTIGQEIPRRSSITG